MAAETLGETRAANARLLRRLVLSPSPTLVESFDDASPIELVREVISRPDTRPPVPTVSDDDLWAPTLWWLTVMAGDDAGFHERMVWFWHGLVTSSVEQANGQPILDQHEIFRARALGNYRELLREITLDPAMLYWLDGAGSRVESPNENYSRELMELFALGRDSGAYTEADVKAGAKALAGYYLDSENDDRLEFEPQWALERPVEFLGRDVIDVDDVIDAVCDRDECPRHVSARLYEHFVGGALDPGHHDALASTFSDAGLDIAPLAEAIVTHESFLGGPPTRARSALEWFLGFRRLIGDDVEVWPLQQLGHVPFAPPNVAGWPGDERWLASGSTLTKAQTTLDGAWNGELLDDAEPIDDVLQRATLYAVSDETRRSLEGLVSSVDEPTERSALLYAAVAMCPEFSLT